MSDLVKIFKEFVDREQLADKNIGIAVSGGIDSTVLLHVAAQILPVAQIFVLHVHHGTRTECDSEWNIVEKMCKTIDTKFVGQKLDTVPTKNREASWRKARQKFFDESTQKLNLDRVLTAHHATDLVETMLWRMTKGTGVAGLAPFDTETKPLWRISKLEIQKYAAAKKLLWSEDMSNSNTNFERNLIRIDVLPTLRKITPNIEQVFVREAEQFSGVADFLSEYLPPTQPLDLKKFLALPPALQSEWLRSIVKKTPSGDELSDCLRWLHGSPAGGGQKMLGGTLLRVDKNTIHT